MEQKVVELLRELSEKLGQTVDSLWPHAVRYIVVSGVMDIFVGVALLLASRFVYTRKIRSSEGHIGDDSYDEVLGCHIVRWIGTSVLFLCGLCYAYYGVLNVVEPIGSLVMKILGG